MNKERLKRYCDLMLISIEKRMELILDQAIKKDIEEKYYQFCTDLTEWEFNQTGNINKITDQIESVENNLYKILLNNIL